MKISFILAVGMTLGSTIDHYKWNLPEGFEPPPIPANNPMTTAKVELGRYLFYERRLSGNGTQACGSCHIQRLAFTDGRGRAVGSTGQVHPRGSMSLVNVAYSKTLTWSNPNLTTLEDQMRVPMFGTKPVELGLEPDGARFLRLARTDKRYQELFRRAYPSDAHAFTIENVIRAIACFARTIISARSDWDADWRQVQHLYGFRRDSSKTSEEARRGEFLFFGDRLSCARCHGGNNFNSTFSNENKPQIGAAFHNNGMPLGQPGLNEYTRSPQDLGKFKAPTMRNIELTAPYMHDGSLPSLESVIDHYAKGGSHSPTQSPLVHGFTLSKQERNDLIAFLRSLTDVEVTRDPRFSDPWISDRTSHDLGKGTRRKVH
jgi:cytochrome c peroxidase